MRTIDIRTTQNVVIQYELASIRDRIFAYVIDAIIIFGSIAVLALFFSLLGGEGVMEVVVYFVLLPIFFFYTLVSEIVADGQSWGKKALGLKVVNLNGREPVLSDYLIRWCFRSVDIYFSLGALASLMVNSTDRGQRLGGLLSNTTVIRTKPNLHLELEDILSISTSETYEPQYLEVRQFSEEDMLLVKRVLERARRFPNEAHRKAMDELIKKISERLGIPQAKTRKEKLKFLNTLLNDYIVLTR